MEGKPFMYDEDLIHQGDSWARAPGTYGDFVSMKELEHPDCDCRISNGPFVVFSKNKVLIRYAEVLLLNAESLIELGRGDDALLIVYRFRVRADASSAYMPVNGTIYT